MARPVRINIPEALYLIQIRSHPEHHLFSSEGDRRLFLHSLGEAARGSGVRVYAFALLECSALFLLRAGHLPLSSFVHRAQAGYFNRMRVRMGKSQRVVRDRYRAILIQEDPYFLPILRRVHLAPIIGGHWSNESEARKWGEVSTMRWSSFPIYAGRLVTPFWFDKDYTFQRFAETDSENPDEAFCRYIIDGVKHTGEDILDKVVAMSLLGDEEFVSQFYESVKGRRRLKPDSISLAQGGKTVRTEEELRIRLDNVVQIVADEYGAASKELLKPRSRHPGRKFVVELALRHALDEGGISKLGERLGVTGGALAHLHNAFRKQLASSAHIRQTLLEMERKLLEI